ncbi:MAG: hypothetical protein FWH11_04090 [Micrococcales bacterium]|nr:hypothetical protein [Micrococcales bacterium]
MRLGGRTWRVLASTVRLGGKELRVVRPAQPVRHAPAYYDERSGGATIVVDKAAAVDLACAWWLAARSPRSLVWLPLRTTGCTCESWPDDAQRLDIVLVHHSLGFRASSWKRVRARAESTGALHTVELPHRPFPTLSAVDWDTAQYHDRRGRPPSVVRATNRDTLRFDLAADTLFVVGSRPAFAQWSDQIRELVEDCPRDMATFPGRHCCAEIGGYCFDPHLHITYCQTHR